MKNFLPFLLVILFSCSDPEDKLQGRWEQSTQYSTSGEPNAGLVTEENDFRYWEFDGDTLDMDGERVPYKLSGKELTVTIDGNPMHFEVTELTETRLAVKTKPKINTPGKFYSFKK